MQAAPQPLQQTATTSPFLNPNTFPSPLNINPNMLVGAVVPMQQGQFPNAFPNPYMMGFAQQPQVFSSPFGGTCPTPAPQWPCPEAQPKVKVIVNSVTANKGEEVCTSKKLVEDFNGSPDSQELKEKAEFLMWKMRCVGGLVPKSEPKNIFEPNFYIALECLAILGGLNSQDYKRFVYDSMIEILENINGDLNKYSSSAACLVNICDVLSEHTCINNVQKNNIDVLCKILKTYSLLGISLLRYSKPQNDGKPLISGFSDEFRQKMTQLIGDMEKLNVIQDLDLKAESQFARSCFCLLNVDSNVLLDIACALDNLCGIAAGIKAEDYSSIRANFIELMKKVTEAKPVFWIDIGIAMRTWGYTALKYKDYPGFKRESDASITAIIKLIEKEAVKDFIFPFLVISMDMLVQLAIELPDTHAAHLAYTGFTRFTAVSNHYEKGPYTFTESRKVWFSGKGRYEAYPHMHLKIINKFFDLASGYRNKGPDQLHEKVVRRQVRNYIRSQKNDFASKVNGKAIGEIIIARLEQIFGKKFDIYANHIVGKWVEELGRFEIKGPAINPYNTPKDDPSAKRAKDAETSQKVDVTVHSAAFNASYMQDPMAAMQYQQYAYAQWMLQQQQMFMYQQAQLGYTAPPAAPMPALPQFAAPAFMPQVSPEQHLSSSGSSTTSTGSSPDSSPTSSSSFPSPASLSPPSSPERNNLNSKPEPAALVQQFSQMTLAPSQPTKPVSYAWLEEEVEKLKDLHPMSRNFDLSKRDDFTITAETAKIIVKAFQANGIKEMRFLILKSKEEYLLLGKEFETTEYHEQTYKCYKEAAKIESDSLKKAALFYKAAGFAEKAFKVSYFAQISYENAIKADLSYSWAAYKILIISNKEGNFEEALFEADKLIKLGVIPDREFLKAFGHAVIQKYSAPTWKTSDFTPKQDLVNMQVHYSNYLASHADDQEIREIANKITTRISELRTRFQGTPHAF